MKSNEVVIGDLRFEPGTGKLTQADGSPAELRHKSKEVLALLVAHRGQTVPKRVFFDSIWADVAVGDESLAQCIADIRRLLGAEAKSIVQTIPREGYRLNATPASPAIVEQPHRHRMASAMVLGAVLVGLAVWSFQSTSQARSGPPVVAVLPLDDLSLGENKGALGDMLSEGIITELARYDLIKVIAKNTSFQFRNSDDDLDRISEILNADYVLSGSQQYDGDAVRVTFQLVDTQTETHVFSNRFDRALGDIFSVQDEIVLQIAASAGQSVMRHAARTRGAEDVSATILSLRARDAFADKFSKESFETAYALESENVAKHPDSPWGHIGVALLLRAASNWGWLEEPPATVLARAKGHAEMALKIDPTNYMAHFARARVHSQSGELEQAILRFEKAAALTPSASDVLIAMETP